MHCTVYKTTNLLDNRYYIGVHKTRFPNDSYLGSGRYIKAAVKKHGSHNFKKCILFDFETEHEAFAKEAELVALHRSDPLCMNLADGGFGGPDLDIAKVRLLQAASRRSIAGTKNSQFGTCWITKDGENKKISRDQVHVWSDQGWTPGRSNVHSEEQKQLNSLRSSGKVISETHRAAISKANKGAKRFISPDCREKMRQAKLGKPVSEETRKKLSVAGKARCGGQGNSQFGTCWITKEGKNKKIKKDQLEYWIREGWNPGRVEWFNRSERKVAERPAFQAGMD